MGGLMLGLGGRRWPRPRSPPSCSGWIR
jgi:hypothetical protein